MDGCWIDLGRYIHKLQFVNTSFEIDEPGILHQTHIRIVNGNGYILLILKGAGEGDSKTCLNREEK